jgi:hypothetical protein
MFSSAVIFTAAAIQSMCFAQDNSSGSDQTAQTAPRRYVEIHEDIKVFLKREATAETDSQRIAAIRDICAVFVELKRDPRLSTHPTLVGYKNKVWTRLNKLKIEFKRYVREQEKQERREKKSNDSQELAEARAAVRDLSQQLSQQMSLVSYSSGGPAGIVNQASGSWGGGAIRANADQLIDLIQKTISPESWDVNGGESVIFFYQPLNALVVRATSEVHENLGGAVEALRRVSR